MADLNLKSRLLLIAADKRLLEVARKAIEAALIETRDGFGKLFISEPFRGNGLVIRERDGSLFPLIRFGPETAMAIGLRAIAGVVMDVVPKPRKRSKR